MKIKFVSFLLCCALFLIISCASTYLALITSKSVKLNTFYNEDEDKTVVLFPMVHVNKPEFFEDVKIKLDSLRRDGFLVFYEGVAVVDSTMYSKENYDTLTLKARKLFGFNFQSKTYSSKENKSLPKAIHNDKYIAQNRDIIGIKDEDVNVDMSVVEMIEVYEQKYGKIKLEDCDFTTPLNSKFKCDRLPNYLDIMIMTRNDTILSHLYKESHKKIALVYGERHFDFMRGALQKQGGYIWLEKQ